MSLVESFLGLFQSNRRVWTAKRAPRVRPSDAKPGTIARVAGRVEPLGELTRAPFTQRACVEWLVRLEQKHEVPRRDAFGWDASSSDVVRWREEFREMFAVPFRVVDEAGGRVLVDVRPLIPAIDAPLVNEDPHVNDENPELSSYLRRHGIVSTAFMGIAGETRFYEAALRPGDAVSVYGLVEEMRSVQAEGYRDAPDRVLRIVGTPEPVILLPA